MLWRTRTILLDRESISCQLESEMNFAAQFFANFVNDGLETRRSFNDSEEYDPFWQRESPAASQCPPESERSDVTGVELHQRVADPLCSPSHPVLPPSTDSHSALEMPKPGPELTLRHQASSPLPHPTPTTPSKSQSGASRRADGPQPMSKAPDPSPVEAADPSSSAALPPFPQLTENASLLSLLQALVYILLRLFLTFILLFLPGAEQRRGSSKPDCSFHSGPCAKDGHIGNGRLGRRSTLICPERLKDFGAEEYLNGDVKVFETSFSEPPEVQLLSTPKPAVKKSSESKTAATAPPEHLRFEDISTAAFKLQQAGIQKTPCTYSRLSKQYGMEIFLKKELLHYTGSVKERGALFLLSSLKQDQQRKGVIVATDSSFSMAVAYHAVELRIPVFVIMPACCSPPHLRMYRDYGAMVISYGSTAQDSINHARHLARENGYLCLEE